MSTYEEKRELMLRAAAHARFSVAAFPLESLDEILAQAGREETLIPIIDPTAWIHDGDAAKVGKETLEAIRSYVVELRRIHAVAQERLGITSWQEEPA